MDTHAIALIILAKKVNEVNLLFKCHPNRTSYIWPKATKLSNLQQKNKFQAINSTKTSKPYSKQALQHGSY